MTMNRFTRCAIALSLLCIATTPFIAVPDAAALPMPAAPIVFDVETAADVPTFGHIDANADDRLTTDELGSWFVLDGPAAEMFAMIDTDGDGLITPEEFGSLVFEPVE